MSYTYTMTYEYPPNLPPTDLPPMFPLIPMPIFKEEAVQRITQQLVELAKEASENPLEITLPIDTATAIEPSTSDVEFNSETYTVTTSTVNALAYVLIKRRKLIDFYVNKLVADILAYCNRRDFPEPLIYTVVELLYKKIDNDLIAAESGMSLPLSRIKQDDTEFAFAVSNVDLNSVFSETLFSSLKKFLNLYRKVKSL